VVMVVFNLLVSQNVAVDTTVLNVVVGGDKRVSLSVVPVVAAKGVVIEVVSGAVEVAEEVTRGPEEVLEVPPEVSEVIPEAQEVAAEVTLGPEEVILGAPEVAEEEV
jgi:hypothetical protein